MFEDLLLGFKNRDGITKWGHKVFLGLWKSYKAKGGATSKSRMQEAIA